MRSKPGSGATMATLTGASGRPALSREHIISIAIEYIDKNGLSALSMRRLAKELHIEAMSLYRHVNGREDLLEGVVDRMVARLHLRPDQEQLGPADGWQAYLQWLAHGVRALAREHPNAFPLIATRHPAAPWLRPPLRSLDVVEDFFAMLMSRGFSDVRAVMAYRAFSSFLLGHLLLEASLLGAQTSPAAEPLDEGGSDVPNADQKLDLGRFPHVQRLEGPLSEDRAEAEFEQALEDVLDRLDRSIAE
ncbi:MAG TPA: TetR/AcrR family transcriptional regulator C-terminal domain-containing protein [Polyangiaceae bacterium]|nr:TetR/AcrR family transcriptional regulator C-terminal domain-containing protein [Polyangiaceae bacterium]